MIQVMMFYKDGSTKEIYDPNTTREDCVKWINEAGTRTERQSRKNICYIKLYGTHLIIDPTKPNKK